MSAVGSVSERAERLLAEILGDGEWHASSDVEAQCLERAGLNGRACRRATVRLGVETRRSGFPARGWWRLPPVEEEVVLAEEGPVVEEPVQPRVRGLEVEEPRFLEHEGPSQFDTPPASWPGELGDSWDRIRF
jgi:hypothetical protein